MILIGKRSLNLIKQEKDKLKEYQTFSLGGSGILLLFATYFYYKQNLPVVYGFVGVAVLFLLIRLVNANWIAPVFNGWIKLAYYLGEINTRILLTLVYILTIIPIGLGMKLFGKDLMDKKIDKNRESYWLKRDNYTIDPKRYERHF